MLYQRKTSINRICNRRKLLSYNHQLAMASMAGESVKKKISAGW